MFVLGGAYLPSKVVTWGPFTDLHRARLSISSTVTYKDWKTESVCNLTYYVYVHVHIVTQY